MSTKKTPEISPDNLKFLFSVLMHCDEIKPNWTKVADDNNIAYARNATARFGTIMKGLGYKYEKGKILSKDVVEAATSSATPKATPTKRKDAQTQVPGSSAKKRKTAKMEEETVEESGDVKAEEAGNINTGEDEKTE